jgi:hypothetical protein
VRYIQGIFQSTLSTADYALPSVAHATTAVSPLERLYDWPPSTLSLLHFLCRASPCLVLRSFAVSWFHVTVFVASIILLCNEEVWKLCEIYGSVCALENCLWYGEPCFIGAAVSVYGYLPQILRRGQRKSFWSFLRATFVWFSYRRLYEMFYAVYKWNVSSIRPPQWSSGQSSQRSRVRFPALPDFLSSSGFGTGSTQPMWR